MPNASNPSGSIHTNQMQRNTTKLWGKAENFANSLKAFLRGILRVAGKELSSFFSSLAGFVFLGVFLAACLFTFFWVDRFFARNIADVRPLFEWMPILLIFLVSALTMRMWSEERRAGTIEVLLTTPIKPVQLVLGKSLACLTLVAIALVLTFPLPITVALLGPLDWGPVIGGYVASLALAAAYISIGLCVSARTDRQIVSLILTALICGAFYLLGSNALTALVGNQGSEVLRLLGSGSRFQSITRGVIDVRDLYYYLSIFGVFLVLNLYALEQLRWSQAGREPKHRQWRLAAGLVIANLVVANGWLGQVGWARADLTQGNIYSISEASRGYLTQLREPLLIRGYFSAETHPLLAPLVPRLRDLLREYELAGGGKIRLEFIDPVREPDLEEEANRRFNIRPVPFQTSSKYTAAVTNSYFDILIKYGDEFETLGYQDLIEIKQRGQSSLDVELRNPEYDLTRAIKKVLYSYRGGGDIFESVPGTVRLEAFVSSIDRLPDPLPQLKKDLDALIADYKARAGEKLTAIIRNPEVDGGRLANQLQQSYGLRPLAVGLLDPKRFWFHVLLTNGDKTLQVPLPESLDKEGLKRAIEAELKRFTPGALRTVALHTPTSTPSIPQLGMASPRGPSFRLLEEKLSENAVIEQADLKDGRVPEKADILIVSAPEQLDEAQVFAIDQFLMKGGTVIVATSSFHPSLTSDLAVTKSASGLTDWLVHHGLSIEDTMVLDPQNTPFPVPVRRNVGGFQVREIRLLDYPYFVDVRRDGLAGDKAPTAGLEQLTLTWASPIKIDEQKANGRTVVRLIESTNGAWTSDTTNIVPDFGRYPATGFAVASETGRQVLAAMIEGRFGSFFAGKPSPLARKLEETEDENADSVGTDNEAREGNEGNNEGEKVNPTTITSVIERSPESSRIILIGSGSFLNDDVLDLAASIDRTQVLAPVRFAENLVDWSLEDRGLLAIRSRGGKFSRTLLPLGEGQRVLWEYLNYALAILGLGAVYGIHRYYQRASRRRMRGSLGLDTVTSNAA